MASAATAVPVSAPSWRITATPPSGPEGIADMLVALGEARIGVTNAVAAVDESGAYELTLDSAEEAIDVLAGIGCDIRGLVRGSTPATRVAEPA